MQRIVFTGGGSGGHTMPAVAVAKRLKDRFEIYYIGSRSGIESEIVKRELPTIPYKKIATGKLRRYFSFKNFFDLFRVAVGLVQSYFILLYLRPTLIFSTGGFVSVPPVIAGKLLGIKIVIHEQTIDAGLANRIAGRFADKILLTFEESLRYFPLRKSRVTGIPLRDEIFSVTRQEAISHFNFKNNDPVIFVTGGGLGCSLMNNAFIEILPELLKRTNIIYQSGNSNNGEDFRRLNELRSNLSIELQGKFLLFNFINDDLKYAYGIADLAVARSGAGTVNELSALKIPAIYIPLAIATNNEQLKNAMAVSKNGGAVIIEESLLTKTVLKDTIEKIIFTDKLNEMKEKMSISFNNNGLEAVIYEIFDLLGEQNGKS